MNFNALDDLFDFLIEQLHHQSFEFDKRSLNHNRKLFIQGESLSDGFRKHINHCLTQSQPADTAPAWLDAIDSFYAAAPEYQSSYYTEYFNTLCLLAPLVYIDHIIDLESFDDFFISANETAFFRCIRLPRSLVEAQRFYQKIVSLPQCHRYTFFGKTKSSSQPLMAQMLFAAFMQSIDEQSENQAFVQEFKALQRECIETCPEYLLDYPDVHCLDGLSYRPAFWLAAGLDKNLREIALKRSTKELARNLANKMKYETETQQVSNSLQETTLSGTNDENQQTSKYKPSETQQKLVKKLAELDESWQTTFPELHEACHAPASLESIENLERLLAPLKLPNAVKTLYQWHNGIGEGLAIGLDDFYSMEEALSDYKMQIELSQDWVNKEGEGHEDWSKCWFTIGGEDGNFTIIPLSTREQEDTPVYSYFIEYNDLDPMFSSIEHMIDCYSQAHKAKAEEADSDLQDAIERCCDVKEKALEIAELDSDIKCIESDDKSTWLEEWKEHAIRPQP